MPFPALFWIRVVCGVCVCARRGWDISLGMLASHSKAAERPQGTGGLEGPLVNLMLPAVVPAGSAVHLGVLSRISADGS